jgi:hypothetical protein
VVVVAGLAADDNTETRDAGETAGLGAELRREGKLERARHPVGVDRGLADAAEVESLRRAVQQPLRDVLVEGRDADGELHESERLALVVAELLEGGAPFCHAWNLSGMGQA